MAVFFTENVLVVPNVVSLCSPYGRSNVINFCDTEKKKNTFQMEDVVGMEYMFYDGNFNNVCTRRKYLMFFVV